MSTSLPELNFTEVKNRLFDEVGFTSKWPSKLTAKRCLYFDERLHALVKDPRFSAEQIFDITIRLGVEAQALNDEFLDSVKAPGDFKLVHFGETGISKLSERFLPFPLDNNTYLFFFSEAMKTVLENQELELVKLLNEKYADDIVTISGPLGGGKAFFLQFLVRKLRQKTSFCRVLYIPNPELFFENVGTRFCAVILEIVFALAGDLQKSINKEFLDELLEFFKTFRTGPVTVVESEKILSDLLSSVKNFCAGTLKVNFIIALDQEDALFRPQVTTKSMQINIHTAFTQRESTFHYLITTTSTTSDAFDEKNPRTYTHFIPETSDADITGLVKMAFQIIPPKKEWRSVPISVQTIVHFVGRWYREIMKVLLRYFHLKGNESIFGCCVFYRFYPDPDIDKCLEDHKAWYTTLTEHEKSSFLMLLAIADCCPSIPSTKDLMVHESLSPFKVVNIASKDTETSRIPCVDLKTYQYIFNHSDDAVDEFSEAIRNWKFETPPAAVSSEEEVLDTSAQHLDNCQKDLHPPAVDFEDDYISLRSFKNIPSHRDLSKPEKAIRFLDQRFFYIDSHLYVRSTFSKIIKAIRKSHSSSEAFSLYKQILSSHIARDSTIAGNLLVDSFLARLQSVTSKFFIKMDATTSSIKKSFSISIPIKQKIIIDDESIIRKLTACVNAFADKAGLTTLLIPEHPSFPDVDLLAVTNLYGTEDSSTPDFVPQLVENTEVWSKYAKALSEGLRPCDLVLFQVTRTISNHEKSDIFLVDKFKAAYSTCHIGADVLTRCTVAKLKTELKRLGCPTIGNRAELVLRLKNALSKSVHSGTVDKNDTRQVSSTNNLNFEPPAKIAKTSIETKPLSVSAVPFSFNY